MRPFTAITLSLLLLTGCAIFQKKGVIKAGNASVAAVDMAGKPATLATSDAKESVAIPKDTTVTITEHGATPTAAAYKTTELRFNSPTEWQKFEATVAANTGTVDTSVAQKKLEVASRAPMLYAAILGVVGAILFVYLHYPTPAMLCGAASVVFFLSWKLSEMPTWIWAVGAAALAAGAALYFGHERGEKTVTQTPVT